MEVEPEQRPFPHEVRIDIIGPDRSVVGTIRGGFQVGPGDYEAEESSLVPMPLDLRPMSVKLPGWYLIDITVDADAPVSIRFKVVEPTTPADQSATGDGEQDSPRGLPN